MRLIIPIIFMLLWASETIQASTRSNVKILEASENIKYIVQEISKDYLLFYQLRNKLSVKSNILISIKELEDNIKTIATSSEDRKIKLLLDFFVYETEQVKQLLKGSVSVDNLTSILDFTESITEGSISIANSIKYNFSFEEEMLIRSKNIKYLNEKATMYYMATNLNILDIEDMDIVAKMNQAVKDAEKDFANIMAYNYPESLQEHKNNLARQWEANKYYLSIASKLYIPNLMIISSDQFEFTLDTILAYHRKEQ